MKSIITTSRDSCWPIGTSLKVFDEIYAGPLTGQPMYKLVEENDRGNEYVHVRFCEEVK